MVQVVDNRADVDGHVVAIRPDELRPEHTVLTMDVGKASAVEGFPNLLREIAGGPAEIVFRSAAVPAVEVGTRVRCRVRLSGPKTVFGERCAPL